jgi:hypothetical protein
MKGAGLQPGYSGTGASGGFYETEIGTEPLPGETEKYFHFPAIHDGHETFS